MVKQTLKAIFPLRPPLPQYTETFDMKKVLTFTKQILGNNQALTHRLISFKCLLLLSLSSISRVSTLLNLGASVRWSQSENAVIPILKLEKQSTGWLQLLELQLYIVDISVKVFLPQRSELAPPHVWDYKRLRYKEEQIKRQQRMKTEERKRKARSYVFFDL